MNPIVKLIIDKGIKLAESEIPKIIDLTSKTLPLDIGDEGGVINSNVCLPKQDLEKILEIRNQIMNKINTVSDSINSLSKITETLQPAIDATNTSLNTAKTLVNTFGAAMVATPPSIPIPGSIITGYVNVSNLVNTTLPPILTTNLNKLNSITSSTDGTIDIPVEAQLNPPTNKVHKTEAGHLVEFDNTTGAERIHIRHTSGTYILMHPNGDVEHNNSNHIKITTGDDTVTISGNSNVTINGDCNLTVGGNYAADVTGNIDLNAGGNVSITGARIDLN